MAMTNRDALEHAMVAIQDRQRVDIERAKAKPRAKVKDEQGAARDAEAWNMLRHLFRIL